MKALRLMVCAIMAFSISLTAMSQSRVFNNYPDNKDISTVYISKAAMRLGLSMGGDDSDMKEIQKCVKNPEGMEIVSATSPQAIAIVKKDVAEKMKKLNMELFLNAQDSGDDVNIYAGKILSGNVMRDILIEASEPNEYTIVYIRGEIDVQALTNQYKK